MRRADDEQTFSIDHYIQWMRWRCPFGKDGIRHFWVKQNIIDIILAVYMIRSLQKKHFTR